jgi:hypothetical protein
MTRGLRGSLLLSRRLRPRFRSNRGSFADGNAAEFSERCAQNFSLRREPVTFGVPLLVTAFAPKLIGSFTDCLFKILHLDLRSRPPPPKVNETAGGRYAAGLASDCRPRVMFRRFTSQSTDLDG